ncbi:hypothetical protein [Streptomyces sp. NPDC056296]|uniref:hypothetical protein n=1 Tax=Streptomyces sp. NPDC056296 TaxID=3345775 RepID=UPI0035DD3870
MHSTALWTAPLGLGVPAQADVPETTDTLRVFARFRAHDWIVNSRNTADETVRTLVSMAGFTFRSTHQADSLDLVQGVITAGLGVGLLPVGTPTFPQVRLMPLTGFRWPCGPTPSPATAASPGFHSLWSPICSLDAGDRSRQHPCHATAKACQLACHLGCCTHPPGPPVRQPTARRSVMTSTARASVQHVRAGDPVGGRRVPHPRGVRTALLTRRGRKAPMGSTTLATTSLSSLISLSRRSRSSNACRSRPHLATNPITR